MARGLPGSGVAASLEGLAGSGTLAAGTARLVANVLLLAAESLPGGGTVTLTGETDGEILVRIDGPRAAWPVGLAAHLADETTAWAALDPAAASSAGPRLQAPLCVLIARDAGLGMTMPIGVGPRGVPPPLLLRLTTES